MILLLSLLVLLSCNVTSKVPQQYDIDDDTRVSFYIKKHLHYKHKYDSLKKAYAHDDMEKEVAGYARVYYLVMAGKYIHSADSIRKLQLQAELSEFEQKEFLRIDSILKRKQ